MEGAVNLGDIFSAGMATVFGTTTSVMGEFASLAALAAERPHASRTRRWSAVPTCLIPSIACTSVPAVSIAQGYGSKRRVDRARQLRVRVPNPAGRHGCKKCGRDP